VLSIVEVILLTVLLVLLVVFAIAALVWVIRWCITRSRKLKGVVRMDVSLNGERLEEAFKKQLDELGVSTFRWKIPRWKALRMTSVCGPEQI
jgi:sensor domain CHASE-containing protein